MWIGSIDPAVRAILDRALDDRELAAADAEVLCHARGPELVALVGVADEMRRRQVGDVATFVVNRNINFTNVCIKHCSFCAFSRDHHQDEAYFLPISDVVALAREAAELGATEVCIQAGLAPKIDGAFYVDLVRALKRELPHLHVHAFSPEEVLYGAARAGVSVHDYLSRLKDAGHDTLPGTSAEILDDDVRQLLSRGRLTTAQWIDVIRTAHGLGLRTTATIMYGHVETYAHWARHLELVRSIQKETGGFTEFVPLSFVHREAPLSHSQGGLAANVRQGPTGADVLKMHAVARLVLGSTVRNIQASWVKEGARMAQTLLLAGANDLGGTLVNESISTTAGAEHGQLLGPGELIRMIREAGRVPAQRSSRYDILRTFAEGESLESPLDQVTDAETRFGSYATLSRKPEFAFRRRSSKPEAP